MVAASQIHEGGPNKPNIIYFRFRILSVTSFQLFDTDVQKIRQGYVLETILFGEKIKTKPNETEISLH